MNTSLTLLPLFASHESQNGHGVEAPPHAPDDETATELDSQEPPKPYKPDDDELADELMAQFDGDYAYFRGQWHRYTMGCWRPVRGISADVIRFVKGKRYVGVKPSKTKCQSVEWFIQTELELEDERVVDNEPDYFNLRNGLFNLRTEELEPHSRARYITCQAPIAWEDSDASFPMVFTSWLHSMLVTPDGKPDEKLYMLVQEAMGYTLTADMSHRVSFWLVGPTGSGKSTLINTMIELMQDYHAVLNLNELGQNRFMLASIAGKRLVTFGESEANLRLSDGIYKTLVSSDMLTADVKNREAISFVPQCKIWWGMNNLPYVADRSGAVDSRVIIIPFRRQIPREKWDLDLDAKIRAELPGIFYFAVLGLRRLRLQGHFTRVDQVEAIKAEYQHSNDVYANFLADEQWCVRGGSTAPTPLWNAFSLWASQNGIRLHATSITIGREWMRLGLSKRNSGGRSYEGITLTPYAQKLIPH